MLYEQNRRETMTRETFTQELLGQRRMLYAFIFSIMRDHALSEDVFQEVMAIALEKQGVFRPGTNIGAWLRAIARRRIMKARERVSGRVFLLDAETIDSIEAAHGRLRGEEWSERTRALERCREKLSERAQRLLHFRYGQGLSFGTIAEQIQSTANSIQVTLSKIRSQLRRCVEAALSADV
jgi:RNA polymerase sigma-70 factor (ECF subfamily)